MSKEIKNVLNNFEGNEINIILNDDNEPLFELYSVGIALGYTVSVKGKLYPRKDRIDKTSVNAEITGVFHDGKLYLSESEVYDFMFEAHTEPCKRFKKWLSNDVLPSIRKYGVYQDREDIDEDYMRFNYNALKKTFGECSVELLEDTYKACMEWHKNNKTRILYKANSNHRKDATKTHSDSKIMIMKKIVDVLEERNKLLDKANKHGIVAENDKVIKQIKDDITKQNNLSNRGKIAGKTKKINQLQEQLESVLPTSR